MKAAISHEGKKGLYFCLLLLKSKDIQYSKKKKIKEIQFYVLKKRHLHYIGVARRNSLG